MEGCASWDNVSGTCFHSGFHPLLCHSMTARVITSTLYPDLHEYLNMDYAALATSLIYLSIYSTDIYWAPNMYYMVF